MHRLLALLSVIVLIAACSSNPPLKAGDAQTNVTPKEAVAKQATNTRVLWGGVIIATTNLQETTQIEVLGFPLGDDQQPQSDEKPIGRFVILNPGYLESADYGAGRRLTVVGTVTGTRQGKIGESDYTYPVVAPEDMHLWPRETYRQTSEPRFHFGVGVIFR